MLTAFESQRPKGICLVCVEEVDVGVFVTFLYNIKLFMGDVPPFLMALVRDLDVNCMRFKDEYLGIGKLPTTKNLAGLLTFLSFSGCSCCSERDDVMSMSTL